LNQKYKYPKYLFHGNFRVTYTVSAYCNAMFKIEMREWPVSSFCNEFTTDKSFCPLIFLTAFCQMHLVNVALRVAMDTTMLCVRLIFGYIIP